MSWRTFGRSIRRHIHLPLAMGAVATTSLPSDEERFPKGSIQQIDVKAQRKCHKAVEESQGVPVAQYYGPGMLSVEPFVTPSEEPLGKYVMNLAKYSKDIYVHAKATDEKSFEHLKDERHPKEMLEYDESCSTINVHLCRMAIGKDHEIDLNQPPKPTMFLDVDVYETDSDSAGKKTLTVAFEGTNDKFDVGSDAEVVRACVEDEANDNGKESGIFAMHAESLLTELVVDIYEDDTRNESVPETGSSLSDPTPIKPYKSKDTEMSYSCTMGVCSHTKIHKGFLKQYLLLRNQVIKKIKDELALNNNDAKSLKIHLTGHSLGGALATICAVDISEQFPELQVTCVTFGSPRVGNSAFVKRYQNFLQRNEANGADKSFRIVEQADVVPRLPMAIRYEHVCEAHYIGKGRNLGLLGTWTHFAFGQGTYHRMTTYIEDLEKSILKSKL